MAAQPGAWVPSLSETWSSFLHLLSNWSGALNSNCLNGAPEGSICWVLVLSTASYIQLTRTPFEPSYIIALRPLNSTCRQSRLFPRNLRPDAPVIYTGGFLFSQLGRVGGQYTTHILLQNVLFPCLVVAMSSRIVPLLASRSFFVVFTCLFLFVLFFSCFDITLGQVELGVIGSRRTFPSSDLKNLKLTNRCSLVSFLEHVFGVPHLYTEAKDSVLEGTPIERWGISSQKKYLII